MLRTAILLTVLTTSPTARAADPTAQFKDKVLPVVEAHCATCHSGEKPKAGLDLSTPPAATALRTGAAHWFRALDQIESGAMPPKGKPPLAAAERKAVADWVHGELAAALGEAQLKEGRSTFRRLNRSEYSNTIEDLFGVRPNVERHLPADGRADGYDKVSAALPLSAVGTGGYAAMAEEVVEKALRPVKPQERKIKLMGGASEQSAGHVLELPDGTKVSFNTDLTSGPLRLEGKNGKPGGMWNVPVEGVHKFRFSVYGYQTDKPLPFAVYAGSTGAYPQQVRVVKILEARPKEPGVVEAEIYLEAGTSFRLVPYGLGVQVPKNSQASKCKGAGLAIQWVEIETPESPRPGYKFLTGDFPEALLPIVLNGRSTLKNLPKGVTRDAYLTAVKSTFMRVGARLFRRDLTAAELDAAVRTVARRVDAGENLKAPFVEQIEALMASPDFLCVVERPGKLSDFAVASRLSYFLWNSTPDAELLAAAARGKLSDPMGLREQTERLLKDPRSDRFVADFTDQWLGLRAINDTTPDRDLYPEYDGLLHESSVLETRATFRHVLDKNLGVRDFVAPKWALVNEPLARHYGFPAVSGVALREVAVPADSPHGGLWTQAATMKVTANGTLTSPVKRGVWVAERLLGTPIPPPPPDIEPVTPDTRGAKTLREQLALHRGSGSCAACHAKFDPYGFALESFDVTGRYRTHYRVLDATAPKTKKHWKDGLPVDPSGATPEGRTFAGVIELRKFLADQPEKLAHGVTSHLLTYATGTPTGPADRSAVARIVKEAAVGGYGLRSLVHALVQSDTFRSK